MKYAHFVKLGPSRFVANGKRLCFSIEWHAGRRCVTLELTRHDKPYGYTLLPLSIDFDIFRHYFGYVEGKTLFCHHDTYGKSGWSSVIDYIKKKFGFLPLLDGINYNPETREIERKVEFSEV